MLSWKNAYYQFLFHHVSNISHTLNRKNKEYFHLINLESRCPQPPVPFHFAPSIMNRITFLFPPRLSSHLDDKRQTAAYYIAAYSLSHIDYLSSAEKVTFVIILSYFPKFLHTLFQIHPINPVYIESDYSPFLLFLLNFEPLLSQDIDIRFSYLLFFY